MRKLFFAIFAVSLLTLACEKGAESETVAAKPDFTGKWEGHMSITDEQIDSMHAMYPEGDRDALERSMRSGIGAMVPELELNEDGTMSTGIAGTTIGTMEGTWELSDDGETITVSYSTEFMPEMVLIISEDGKLITVRDETGGLGGSIEYTRPGTVTIEKHVPDDPFTYASTGEVSDFVGVWGMSYERIDSMWDSMRGTMSEEDAQRMMGDMGNETDELEIFDDMTYKMTDVTGVQEGDWTLSDDGATAFIELSKSEVAAMGLDIKLELRLTEDKTTLVLQDMTGFGGPIMSFKRK